MLPRFAASKPPCRDRFAREIAGVLVVKTIAICALWLAFFSSPPAPSGGMDPQRVAEHLVAPAAAAHEPAGPPQGRIPERAARR